MKKTVFTILFSLMLVSLSIGQNARNIEKEAIPTAMFEVTYGALFPAFDTKTDYGFTNTVGGSVIFKSESNWLLTANGNFVFGNQIKGSRIDNLGESITTVYGEVIGGGGLPSSLAFFQRGMHFQAKIGKLFAFKPNPNSGFFVQAGIGYLRNRIRIDYQIESQNPPYPLLDDYQYGYDRMRGGWALHGETGYLVMSNSRILNFSVSLEATYARTRNLRDYDFRVFYDENGNPQIMGYNDKTKRFNDFYYGIRLSWMIPTYQRQPEEYYYY
ncbi:MAG: hypothetical protein IKU00_03625 [Bacteroidales bacterium]|nr:hypothetical protein [Bacteroidales bacterium]